MVYKDLMMFQEARSKWIPDIPFMLDRIESLKKKKAAPPSNPERVASEFPHVSKQSFLTFEASSTTACNPLKVGVLFSGGQAAGGHNVVSGLFDALKQLHPKSTLIGFLNGPQGLLDNKSVEITKELIAPYRNMGGFDLLGSSRVKIEDLEKARVVIENHQLDGLIIIGGDDSNTNAVFLAEYLAKERVDCSIVGVPKTIDGDLQSEYIEISFGFDTACKTYASEIGDISRDILSAKKYWAFIRLMGRSASHISLECALNCKPNLALISEEIYEKKKTLSQVVDEISQLVIERSKSGKNYGVILIPEGILEFLSLNDLPVEIQNQFFSFMDPHGNVKVSQIETERLLIDLVKQRLSKMEPKVPFSPLPFFFGYEGRSSYPSNFDACYCYALGRASAVAIREKANGTICTLQNLKYPIPEWRVTLVPLTTMLNYEMRKGVEKAVIKKTLVDLKGEPFLSFRKESAEWRMEDQYKYPGPIQFYGPKEMTDSAPQTLMRR